MPGINPGMTSKKNQSSTKKYTEVKPNDFLRGALVSYTA